MISGHRKTTDFEGHFYCKEYIPEIAGKFNGLLMVCGGGKNFWEDYGKAKEILKDQEHDVMAVNVAGLFVPNIDHLFSLHYKQIGYISKWRKVEYGKGQKFLTHATKEHDGVDYRWYLATRTSTSGFMALIMGLILGYRQFILCGVPMDGSGYFYKPSFNATFSDKSRQKEIEKIKDIFGNNVKSMSGNTAKVLGYPTPEWVKEGFDGCIKC